MPACRRAGIRVLLGSESWQTHSLRRGLDANGGALLGR